MTVPPVPISTDPVANALPSGGTDAPALRPFVFSLFFIFGGITSLNDVIIPKLKTLFTLSYAEAMLVQSAFFAAYLVVSLPAAALVKQVGYMRGAIAGLLLMTAGCLLFGPAARSAAFGAFLAALFVLASGITVVQVVANPLISLLGPPVTASSRLTFAQAFNSLDTTIFPYAGAALILGDLVAADPSRLRGAALAAYRADEGRTIAQAYVALALVLAAVAAAVWAFRDRLPRERHAPSPLFGGFDLLRHRRFASGALCIFLYVGAEVALGSIIVNYLMQSHVMGLDAQAAGKLIPIYWGGALVGRFVGSGLLRVVDPGRLLAAVAAGAILLILVSANSGGAIAGYSLLAIGLMNAIMFPTIFSLASDGLGARAADGSGVICVAIIGGAVIPPATGWLADVTGSLALAQTLPALCYAVILSFGLYSSRPSASG